MHAAQAPAASGWQDPLLVCQGTHQGVYLERSTGLAEKAQAARLLRRWKDDIERGALERPGEPTFLTAVVGYLRAGGDPRFLGAFDEDAGRWTGIVGRIGDLTLPEVDQQTIDETAIALLPSATAATRNRQIYTPISAVLKHAGVERKLRRPKGWRGSPRTDWMTPDQAFRLIRSATGVDAELGVFLTVLLYTGLRLGEALALTCDRIDLKESYAFVPATKNGDPRAVFLPPAAAAALANLPRGLDRGGERAFRFRKSGRLYQLFGRARNAAGSDLGFVSFHIFRHTWATWMRRYGGLDTTGLVATGAWRDRTSAARYEHAIVSEEARKAMLLPVEPRKKRRATR